MEKIVQYLIENGYTRLENFGDGVFFRNNEGLFLLRPFKPKKNKKNKAKYSLWNINENRLAAFFL